MPRPENVFIDALFFINAFLSLLPAVFVFIKKKYFKEVLTFLMLLCLFNFFENVVLMIIPRAQISNQNTVQNIFSLVELMLVIQMFALILSSRYKELVTIFSIIFLAVIITIYFFRGINEKVIGVEISMQIVIIIVAGIISFVLVEKKDVMIFDHPLSWIAIGTLFYCLTDLLVNTVSPGTEGEKDKVILLNIASFVRYVFYALAVLNYKDDDLEDDIY